MIEIFAFFRVPFPMEGISSPIGFGVMHFKKVADEDWATFTLWALDFGPSSSRWQSESLKAVLPFAVGTRGFLKKHGIF